jgi:chemotaxis protein MotA
MIILAGAIIVLASVLGGFTMLGGQVHTLMHLSEFITIGGAALGALVIMSPKQVLIQLAQQIGYALRGTPYNRTAYEDLLKALYELFQLARRNGMIALEEHVISPDQSAILSRYPRLIGNRPALDFLCNSLRPLVDGKVRPDQLRHLLEVELGTMETEQHASVSVLVKAADAMPGFGIVAAVLGIVVTMASIAGPIEHIGEKVAAALVGTFLGIFLSYGFLNPLAANIEFINAARLNFFKCIADSVVGYASGLAPLMSVELARRGLCSEVRPRADDLEAVLRALTATANKQA